MVSSYICPAGAMVSGPAGDRCQSFFPDILVSLSRQQDDTQKLCHVAFLSAIFARPILLYREVLQRRCAALAHPDDHYFP